MPQETDELEYETFIRKPFKIQAVLITEDNIEQIAEEIGRIQYKRDNGEPYIRVNPHLIPNLQYVYLGFWMTKMVVKTDTQDFTNYRCYSGKAFDKQFAPYSEHAQGWMDFLDKESAKRKDGEGGENVAPSVDSDDSDAEEEFNKTDGAADEDEDNYNLVKP